MRRRSGILGEDARLDHDAVRREEALDDPHELPEQPLAAPGPAGLHLVEHLRRPRGTRSSGAGSGARAPRGRSRRSVSSRACRRPSAQARRAGSSRAPRAASGSTAREVEGQPRAVHLVDAHARSASRSRSAFFSRHGLDARARASGAAASRPRLLVRQEREGHAEDVHELGIEEAGLGSTLVARAAQPAPHHLLAEELAREGAQPHDVGDGLGVPALGEHRRRRSRSGRRPGLARLPDRVDLLPQRSACSSFVSLRTGPSSSSASGSAASSAAARASSLASASSEHLRVDVEQRARGRTARRSGCACCSKACAMRAAVSVRFATVIITGGVGAPASCPLLRRLEPVAPEQVVGIRHELAAAARAARPCGSGRRATCG